MMSTIARPAEQQLTVSQIDKRLAMYARNLKRVQHDDHPALSREQALFNVDMLLGLRLELTGAAA